MTAQYVDQFILTLLAIMTNTTLQILCLPHGYPQISVRLLSMLITEYVIILPGTPLTLV